MLCLPFLTLSFLNIFLIPVAPLLILFMKQIGLNSLNRLKEDKKEPKEVELITAGAGEQNQIPASCESSRMTAPTDNTQLYTLNTSRHNISKEMSLVLLINHVDLPCPRLPSVALPQMKGKNNLLNKLRDSCRLYHFLLLLRIA